MAGALGSWLCGIDSQEAEMNSRTELASPHPPDPWDGSLETLSQRIQRDIVKPVLGSEKLRMRLNSHMLSKERPVRGLAHFTG